MRLVPSGGLTSPSRQGGAGCGGGRGGAGGVLWGRGQAGRGRAVYSGSNAAFFFFLFSFVFLSPLLNSQSDRGEDAAYEPTNYTLLVGRSLHFFITIIKIIY